MKPYYVNEDKQKHRIGNRTFESLIDYFVYVFFLLLNKINRNQLHL
jgi:hypothetical protein